MQSVESNILATLHFIATQPYMLWSLFTDTPVSIWVKLSHEQFIKLKNKFTHTFVIPELRQFNSYFLQRRDYFQILDTALWFFSIFNNMSLSYDSCQVAQSNKYCHKKPWKLQIVKAFFSLIFGDSKPRPICSFYTAG